MSSFLFSMACFPFEGQKLTPEEFFLFVAKVDLFLFVYIFRVITERGRWVVGGWGMKKGIGVSSVQE